MMKWFALHNWAIGVVTFFLMWSDWLLTILQERERNLHYGKHYQSYPVDTIEGHPLYQSAVKKMRIIEIKHLIPALAISALVVYALGRIPQGFHVTFIGYVWGLFLIVLALRSDSPFITGVALAGVTSAPRHLLWLKRFLAIEAEDKPPISPRPGASEL